jgi:hypothetical protein
MTIAELHTLSCCPSVDSAGLVFAHVARNRRLLRRLRGFFCRAYRGAGTAGAGPKA